MVSFLGETIELFFVFSFVIFLAIFSGDIGRSFLDFFDKDLGDLIESFSEIFFSGDIGRSFLDFFDKDLGDLIESFSEIFFSGELGELTEEVLLKVFLLLKFKEVSTYSYKLIVFK